MRKCVKAELCRAQLKRLPKANDSFKKCISWIKGNLTNET